MLGVTPPAAPTSPSANGCSSAIGLVGATCGSGGGEDCRAFGAIVLASVELHPTHSADGDRCKCLVGDIARRLWAGERLLQQLWHWQCDARRPGAPFGEDRIEFGFLEWLR